MSNEEDKIRARRFEVGRGWADVDEEVTGEAPLTVYVNGVEFATVVCSPWEIEHMAVGFLCSEGIVRKRKALGNMEIDREQGIVHVEIDGFDESMASQTFLKRYIHSCCGRSRASFYFFNDAMLCKSVTSDVTITPECALELMRETTTRSDVFKRTGGVHAGLVADTQGRVLSFHEDIGRNNVLDRIYGRCFLEDVDLSDKVVSFTGRVSSEIVLKMSKMGVPILVSHAAPSGLGLELADDLGITVAAFTRGDRLTAYTHARRIG